MAFQARMSTMMLRVLPSFFFGERLNLLILLITFHSAACSLTSLRGSINPADRWRDVSPNLTQQRIIERRMEDGGIKVPQLVGEWSRMADFPVDTGESQGTLVGCDLTSVGGFFPNFSSGPTITYMLDLCNPDADWREMKELPVFPFLTHGAHAHKGDNLMYLCGGYRGKHAGESIDDCYVFDKTDGVTGSWTPIASLPQKLGGGGMVYIESEDKLMFSLGALRPTKNSDGVDQNKTWFLDIGDADAQWVARSGGSPYLGNHVTSIVAKDCAGNTRYYFLGGQVGEQEKFNNIDLVFEYIPSIDLFVPRQSMHQPRGHFTTANAPYGCGFITVGGAINGDPTVNTWSDDVLYYDIDSDTWHSIGTYPELIKTPVCGIVSDVLYCSNGYTVNGYKIELSFDGDGAPPPPTATVPPTTSPTSVGPTSKPAPAPTAEPIPSPTSTPTSGPAHAPTPEPIPNPTLAPTPEPTPNPTPLPTPDPTPGPTLGPTPTPTPPVPSPTQAPVPSPTPAPSPVSGKTLVTPAPLTGAPVHPPSPGPSPAPSPASDIENFKVIDPNDGSVLMMLTNDTVIDSSILGTLTFNVRADIVPGKEDLVGSVEFQLFPYESDRYPRTENRVPYTLAGDVASFGIYFAETFETSVQYTIIATPYSMQSKGGAQGQPWSVVFTLI